MRSAVDLVRSKILEDLEKRLDETTKQQETSRVAAKQVAGVVKPDPTLAVLGQGCENIAVFWLNATTVHGVTNDAILAEQIEKLRRLIRTEDADHVKSAAALSNSIAMTVAKAILIHVFGPYVFPTPIENQEFLTPVMLQAIKDTRANAEKKILAIRKEIDARLTTNKLTLGVFDQTLVASGYIQSLCKFLDQPYTENQIVLRMLLMTAQSINAMLANVFETM